METRTYDLIALLARIGVGVVFTAHGWEKIRDGIDQTTQSYQAMRVPFPAAIAVYSTFVELLGGLMLVLGLALPFAGALLFLDMLISLVLVHADNGLFVTSDPPGFELVLVLGLVALVFAFGGGGRATVDRLLFPRRPAGRRAEAKGHVRTLTGRPSGESNTGDKGDKEPFHAELNDDPSPNWVSELKEDPPFEYGRASRGSGASSADEGADGPDSDVLVAGKKPGGKRTSGTSSRTRKPSAGKPRGTGGSKGGKRTTG
jgi:putative oxidoreductase